MTPFFGRICKERRNFLRAPSKWGLNLTSDGSLRSMASLAEQMAVHTSKQALEAKFSASLGDQLADFKRCGFVLIKMKKNDLYYNAAKVEAISSDITSHFTRTERKPRYHLWRWFNSVNSPTKRHSIRLPLTEALRSLMNGCIASIRPFLEAQLPDPKSSPLVELSAVISLPGSGAQAVHTDTMFPGGDTTPDQTLILTAMLALQDISLDMGPTFVFSGSNQKAFHAKYRRHIKENGSSHYDSYGDIVDDYVTAVSQDEDRGGGGKTEPGAESNSPVLMPGEVGWEGEGMQNPTPEYAVLQQGDVLLFDSKLFHFGGANSSKNSRNLLSWSFQKPVLAPFAEPGDEKSTKEIYGFTYHLEADIKEMGLTLQDFFKQAKVA